LGTVRVIELASEGSVVSAEVTRRRATRGVTRRLHASVIGWEGLCIVAQHIVNEAESNVPDLLGVSEVAAALGVSRQRVSELAESDDFPPPIARLKAGPIWQRSQISRFVGNWDRRPGPKPGARRRQAAA
jgi:predicted DNA-binding transcriptional regulator AlpA